MRGRRHVRQNCAEPCVLSVDISGPFQEGWDLDGGKPRYFLVASLTVPGGEHVAEESSPPQEKEERDSPAVGQGEDDVFDERLEDYDLEGLFPDPATPRGERSLPAGPPSPTPS